MKVKFQSTKQEYARACWMHFKTRFHLKLDAALIVLGVALGGWLLSEGETFWGGLLLGIMGLFVGLLVTVRFIIPYYVYQQYILNRGEYSLDFTEEDIHFKAANIDSRLNWSMYTHALSGQEHYLLYYGKNQYTIIPRRVFESADQLNDFDHLLRQKIKNVKVT